MQPGGVEHLAEGVVAEEELRTEELRNAAVAEDSLVGAAVMHSEAAQGEDGRTGRRYCRSRLSVFPCSCSTGQNHRTRESSVAISPEWQMLEEIEFHRLSKLRLEVDEPEDLYVFVYVQMI